MPRTKQSDCHGRGHDSAWLRREIRRLARIARSNWREDRARAKSDDDQVRYAMAETSAYYMKNLDRILSGRTWEEDFKDILSGGRS